MELNNKSQKNLPPIYSEGYQHVPIYDIGFQQPTAPVLEQHVPITQQPQQVIVQSKYYDMEGYIIRIYTFMYSVFQ